MLHGECINTTGTIELKALTLILQLIRFENPCLESEACPP